MTPDKINVNDTTPILTADAPVPQQNPFENAQVVRKNGELFIMSNGVILGKLTQKKLSYADRLKEKFQQKRLAEIQSKQAKQA